jgi:Zn-dependent protease
MFGTMKLGRVLGIDILLHSTFWLLPLLVILGNWGNPDGDLGHRLALLFAVFGCVALHELGHALAALLFGIRTRDITLLPFGGIARLERFPQQPLPEIVIALAGPAVNVAIIAVLLVPHAFLVGSGYPLSEFLSELIWANGFLVVFNLIPAFPMDGGRVFRATLQFLMPRYRATQIAAGFGALLAIGLLLLGIVTMQLSLILVGAVVLVLGQAELAVVRRMQAVPRPMPPPYFAPSPYAAQDLMQGWHWDSRLRAWVEYQDGFPVRARRF